MPVSGYTPCPFFLHLLIWHDGYKPESNLAQYASLSLFYRDRSARYLEVTRNGHRIIRF